MSDFHAESAEMSNKRKVRMIPMYDELIKNLRHDSASALQNCEFDFVHDWMLEAADAIEELQTVVDGLTAQTNMVFEKTEGRTVIKFEPKWIPVTERLPEPEGHREYIVCVKHFNPEYKRNILVTTAEFEARVAECGEGPYWDGHNDGITRVTHWMPLPQPPKDGER